MLTMLLRMEESGMLSIFVANAGDCRAVLSRGGEAIPLSRDHKVNTKHSMSAVPKPSVSGVVSVTNLLNRRRFTLGITIVSTTYIY